MSEPLTGQLLPPNATELERALAESGTAACNLPVPMRELWNVETCPERLLPWLAYAFGLTVWDPDWPVAVKRSRIRNAIPIAKHRGTAGAVRDVVRSFGAGVALREAWQQSPMGTPHTFEITLTVGAGVPRGAAFQKKILEAVDEAKNVRSHYSLIAGVAFSGRIGVVGAFRAVRYERLQLSGNADDARATSDSGRDQQTTPTTPTPPTAAYTASGDGTTGDAQTFDASAASGSAITYGWTFGDGKTGAGKRIQHTFDSAGSYTVTLTVTDSAQQTNSVAKTVSIADPMPAAPAASFTRSGSAEAGSTQTFDASESTGDQLTYKWTFGDNANGTGETVEHTYSSSGSYTATLNVTDSYGRTDSASRTFSIARKTPAPPVAAFSVGDGATAGQSTAFDASSSTGDQISYSWDFGDDASGTGVSPSHAYAGAGTYSVTLTVTDSVGQTDTATHSVSVAAAAADAPTAAFTQSGSLRGGKSVTFDATGSTGADLSYAWQFPDGSTGAGAKIDYTWQSAGDRSVTLTVTDSSGQTATTSHTYTVSADPRAAVLDLFSGGADGAVFDPSDLSTLWQDTDATTPVTNADQPVARADDLSGNGKHALAPSDSARPMLRSNGGAYWLEFDGVDDCLLFDPMYTDDNYTMCAGVAPADADSDGANFVLDQGVYTPAGIGVSWSSTDAFQYSATEYGGEYASKDDHGYGTSTVSLSLESIAGADQTLRANADVINTVPSIGTINASRMTEYGISPHACLGGEAKLRERYYAGQIFAFGWVSRSDVLSTIRSFTDDRSGIS